MSPEERAKDVLSDFDFNPVVTQLLSDAIAQAIRDAEDAALERAAGVADRQAEVWGADMGKPAEVIAASIRAGKAKRDTPEGAPLDNRPVSVLSKLNYSDKTGFVKTASLKSKEI